MVLIWLLFLLFCAIGWLLLFPALGRQVAGLLSSMVRSAKRSVLRTGGAVAQHADASGRIARDASARTLGGVHRHRYALVGAVLLITLPVITILAMRKTVTFDSFLSHDQVESRTLVAELLRGERLQPPPAPPPEVFLTEEIRRLKPEIVKADRKWDQIDADLQQRVLVIFEVLRREYDIQLVLVEGYRSPERQAQLMREGRATRAGAWQSCHQYGLAIDAAPMRDGKLQWDMNDPWTRRAYFLYGDLAEQAGLTWGGNWRSLKDYVHVENTGACRQARRERLAREG
ncbi:M15 family metallopeptidase [Luteimonas terrae]|uniref:Peptidoglycan L-alanyl-D-glutamate endopeptidase CwlK n=1 Tax=Luteimonas terrae TaxID=1530191 RepID=A0ABU1XWW2_9GAMM|nr:M15 family metallopeptidase [Luteimonas terrae]MDR7192621.1 peptidoglycan L-alanyl-D-glutamate endopeptidase CwlK [Luteimonas terrae]